MRQSESRACVVCVTAGLMLSSAPLKMLVGSILEGKKPQSDLGLK